MTLYVTIYVCICSVTASLKTHNIIITEKLSNLKGIILNLYAQYSSSIVTTYLSLPLHIIVGKISMKPGLAWWHTG